MKLVEAEPLTTITEAKIMSFVWKSIVYRFGIPYVVITDTGKQFSSMQFKE